MWHRRNVWLDGIPYGRLCLGETLLEHRPQWIAEGSRHPDRAGLRRLATAAARARAIERNRAMRAPFEELAEREAELRQRHRDERKAIAAAQASEQAKELSAIPRKWMSPKVIEAIGAVTTLLAGAVFFLVVYRGLRPSTYTEFQHWPTAAVGTASGAVFLVYGIFLRIRRS
jgi:hypothetical protein